jgi:phospholipid transport system substrate-binding protein
LTLLAVVFGMLALGAGPAMAQDSPDLTVQRAVDGVTSALDADKAIQTGDRHRINALVDTKVMPYVNIARMTQAAMGPHWAHATPEQRAALGAEFKRLLTNAYAGAFTRYQPGVKIEVRPSRVRPGDTDATVRSLVSNGGAEPIPLDYYLEQIDGVWKVTDFAVFGARMVEVYKGQFNGAITANGVDGLIKTLVAKNNSNEARSAN